MGSTATTRLRRRRVVLATAAVLAAVGVRALPADAADIATYTGSTTGAASSITLHKGDAFERVLNPSATATASIDQDTGVITAASTTFDPAYSETFAGPFGLWLYVQAQLEQVGSATGTVSPTGDPAVRNVTLNVTNKLRVTVFRVQPNQPNPPNPQNPATDQKLTLPERCWVDISMTLTGTLNLGTGELSLAQDPFTIPNFPGDPGDAANPGGTPTHRCQTATSALNEQLAGTNNAVDLNFTGNLTTTTSTTQSTTTTSTTTSTTLPTTTTSTTTSTTLPTTTSTTTSTTQPTTTTSTTQPTTTTSTTQPTTTTSTTSTTQPTTTTSTTEPTTTTSGIPPTTDPTTTTSSTPSSTSTSVAPGSTSTTSDILGGNVDNTPGGSGGSGSVDSGTLPRTGSDLLPLVAIGSTLVLLGGLVLLRRRSLHQA